MAVATQPWVVRLPSQDTYGWFYHKKEEFYIPVNEIDSRVVVVDQEAELQVIDSRIEEDT